MGDSGTGKSTLIRQILLQLEARGETAIVYDPALEYTPQFYTPERGDLILNPLDARSPSWSPGDEVRHDAEAQTLARRCSRTAPHDTPFFTEGPRRIFAHLLTFHPTAEELASWLCHTEDIDRRVTDTTYAAMIDPHGPGAAERRARLAQHGGGCAHARARPNARRPVTGARRRGRPTARAGCFSPARRRRATRSSR